jgi:hypothetical protein
VGKANKHYNEAGSHSRIGSGISKPESGLRTKSRFLRGFKNEFKNKDVRRKHEQVRGHQNFLPTCVFNGVPSRRANDIFRKGLRTRAKAFLPAATAALRTTFVPTTAPMSSHGAVHPCSAGRPSTTLLTSDTSREMASQLSVTRRCSAS